MTFDEWVLYGIAQQYCTTADCLTHNVWELYERVPYLTDEELEDDEPPCVPAVILLPPDEVDA